jgi:hypothetical protein
MWDHKEQERMVKELEVAIERLQALYNQYFMGIERLEPTIPKKAVERLLNELRKIKFYNTALRFRFQSQVQKYSTHLTHWRRICRQIEEGTYKRDIMRAKARVEPRVRQQEETSGATEYNEQELDNGLPVFDLEQMLNEVEDAFEQGFNLDEQLNALTSMPPQPAPSPSRPHTRDEVNPVGTGPGGVEQRPSGVPIPISSLKASRKTDEARNTRQQEIAPGARFHPMETATRKGADAGQRSVTTAAAPPMPPARPQPQPTMQRRPKGPPPPPRKPSPADTANASRAQSTGGIDDQRIQSVYRAYIAARKKTNERTDNISLQKISDLLKKTEKAKGGVSDFKVVIRDGKAVIKTVK